MDYDRQPNYPYRRPTRNDNYDAALAGVFANAPPGAVLSDNTGGRPAKGRESGNVHERINSRGGNSNEDWGTQRTWESDRGNKTKTGNTKENSRLGDSRGPARGSTSQYQSNNTSSIDVDQKAITEKLSAWHSLVDPDAENVKGGIGSGQLHRSGRNYIPVSEQEVLEIQRKNKKWGGKKKRDKDRDRKDRENVSRTSSRPSRHSTQSKRSKSPTNPGLNRRKSTPAPAQSSSRYTSSPLQPKNQFQYDQQLPQQQQQHYQHQQQQQQQQQQQRHQLQSSPSYRSSHAGVGEKYGGTKSGSLTSDSSEEYAYRSGTYNDSLQTSSQESESDSEGQYETSDYERDYEQNGYRLREHYQVGGSRSHGSGAVPSTLHPTYCDEVSGRKDVLLKINIDVGEADEYSIYVCVNDNPADLARMFCKNHGFTNPQVEEALAKLIEEEKRKRLG